MTDDHTDEPQRAAQGDQLDPVEVDDTAADALTEGTDAEPAIPRHAAFMRPGTVPEELLQASLSDEAVQGETEIVESVEDSVPTVTAMADAEQTAAENDEDAGEPVDELVAGRQERQMSAAAKVTTGIVAAAVAVGAFFGVRAMTGKDAVVVETTASVSASSESPTPTQAPPFTTAMLITPADAAAIFPAKWTEAETWETIPENAPGITCLSNLRDMPNPTISRQRGLSSDAKDKTALLQRLDGYATEADAQKAYAISLKALSGCDDIPALLTSAATYTGAGDDAFSMTVAFEDDPQVMHTIVLNRTGRTVSMVDVSTTAAPAVSGNAAMRAGAPTLSRLCGPSDGTCPDKPTGAVTNFPPTGIAGWLAQSDIPRVTKGQGMWSATNPVKVTSTGSQCEDMTLASVKGPTDRLQRSYLLTQDDAAPERFGIDEVLFTFANDADAASFVKKLSTNVDGCAKRADTAKVTKPVAINARIDNHQLTGKTWTVTQATGPNSSVVYRVGVVQAGPRVTYTVSNVTKSFDFADEAWKSINVRAAQRSLQAKAK